MMRYFRRPSLAGKNLPRVKFAKVRGSIRRRDADATYSYPYFPDVVLGTTLELTIGEPMVGPTPYVVAINHNGIYDIIDDINAVIGPDGMAIEEDGAISIQNVNLGADYIVSITGGTAAAALGFDLSLGSITSVAGEIESTPHGRVGNPNGVALLNTGENLNASSVQRAASRLADNADVLYSDVSKQRPTLQKVTSYTVSTNRNYITPAAATRLFTGGPAASNVGSNLTNTSTKEDLAAHYVLIDPVTKQPAANRIVAVTRGVPVGSLPYANATSWHAAGSVGNVLGTSIRKDADPLGILINNIKYGRIVELYAPLDPDVVEGDFVEIHDATNLANGSNNGLRWVLERIVDSTHVTLRPMSAAELEQLGQSFADSQAKVDLNDHKEMPEAWGYARFYTGLFTTNVNLFVDPPLPPNSNYELWASQPVSDRDEYVWKKPQSQTLTRGYFTNDLDTTKNVLLSAPTLTNDSTTVTIGGYYARWHGRTIYVPEATFTPPTPNVKTVYYWDERTAQTSSIDAADFPDGLFNKDIDPSPALSAAGGGGERGIPLAVVDTNVSAITSSKKVARVEGQQDTVTVGWGGDFPDLPSALRYVNVISRLSNNELQEAEGNYPHFTVVLLNNQDVSTTNAATDLLIATPALTIKGATPSVRVNFTGAGGSFVFNKALAQYTLVLEDLVLAVNTSSPVTLVRSFKNLVMRNVVQDTSDSPFTALCSNPEAGGEVHLSRCSLYLAGGVVWGIATPDLIVTLRDSFFYYGSLPGVTTQLISSSVNIFTAVTLKSFLADNCQFVDFPASTPAAAVLLNGSTVSTSPITVQDCYFSFNSSPAPAAFSRLLSGMMVKMVRTVVDGKAGAAPVPAVLLSSNGIVEDSILEIRGGSSLLTSVQVAQMTGTTVTCYDSVTGTNGIAVSVSRIASGNLITGPTTRGLEVLGSGSSRPSAVGNAVYLTDGANTKSSCGIYAGDGSRVVGNRVTLPSTFVGRAAIQVDTGDSDTTVSGNIVAVSGNNCAGILSSGNSSLACSGNVVTITDGGASSNGIYSILPKNTSISANTVKVVNADSSPIGTSVSVVGPGDFDYSITGNSLIGPVSLEPSSGFSIFSSNTVSGDLSAGLCVVSSNTINGDVTVTASCDLKDNIINGQLSSSVSGVSLNVLGNRIAQEVSITDPSTTNEIVFDNNSLSTDVTLTSKSVTFLRNTCGPSGSVGIVCNTSSTSNNVFENPITISRISPLGSSQISLSENKFQANADLQSVTSVCANHFYAQVLVSGNSISKCSFSDNIVQSLLPLTASNCSGSGNHISSAGITLTSCKLVSGRIAETNSSVVGLVMASSEVYSSQITAHHISASGTTFVLENCEVRPTVVGPIACAIGASSCSMSGVTSDVVSGKFHIWITTSATLSVESSLFYGDFVSTGASKFSLSNIEFSGSLSVTSAPGSLGENCVRQITSSSSTIIGSGSNSALVEAITVTGALNVSNFNNIVLSGCRANTLQSTVSSSLSVRDSVAVGAVTVGSTGGVFLNNVTGASISCIEGSYPKIVGCTAVSGNLCIDTVNKSNQALVDSCRIDGNISGTSSGIVCGLRVVKTSMSGRIILETNQRVAVHECRLSKIQSYGDISAPSPRYSDLNVTSCIFTEGSNESGIFCESTEGIDAVITGCTMNSIMLLGKAHHVMISNNDIDGSYTANALPIQILDGDGATSIHIQHNKIRTNGVNYPVKVWELYVPDLPALPYWHLIDMDSSCGCIVIGDNMIHHEGSESSRLIPNVHISGNSFCDAFGSYSHMDVIRFAARVMGGSVSGNTFSMTVGGGMAYFRTQSSDSNSSDKQSNNISFCGNVMARRQGGNPSYNVTSQSYNTLYGLSSPAVPPPATRAPGYGDTILLCHALTLVSTPSDIVPPPYIKTPSGSTNSYLTAILHVEGPM